MTSGDARGDAPFARARRARPRRKEEALMGLDAMI